MITEKLIFQPIGSRTKNYLATTIEGTTREDAEAMLMRSDKYDEILWPKEGGGYNSLLRSEIPND